MPPSLGDLLRQYRRAAALTQEETAARAQLSIRTLRELERDRLGRPRPQTLRRLAAALGLSRTQEATLLGTLRPRPPGTADPRPPGTADPGDGAEPPLSIGILGPLTVSRDGVPLDVGPAMQRRLLGLLALQPRRVVSRERIVDSLWGHDPPRTCHSSVHVYVSRLRALLEPGRRGRVRAEVLVQSRDGYLLAVDDDQLDLARFDRLEAQARAALAAGDRAAAALAYAEALACWRGPVLAGIGGSVREHPAVVAAADRRVAATLALAEADPYGDPTVEALRRLAADDPLHESVHARLMLALAGRGEQATALAVFDAVRDRLDADLGLRPGTELADAHLKVLRQERPPATGPAQLPPDVPAFAGRTEEMRRLLPSDGDGPAAVTAISGMAGVGKTALAVHFAHAVRDRYPDGQLYANLHGYAAGAARRPIDVLASFLHALGVAPERVPADLDEASALYRSLLAGRRMIVLLDNANAADQVRPLLPGDAGCLTLVTSREALAGLVARDGARPLRLEVLSLAHSLELLARVLGADAVRAEPRAAAELARRCAFLPLALRIAAAKVSTQPTGGIAAYVAELTEGNRLAALEVSEDSQAAVRAAFDLSYAALPPSARNLFRRTALVPGPDATVEAAAALAGTSVDEAAGLLARLAAAHLVVVRDGGRYTFHDLLRLYARERSRLEDGEAERDAALGRLFDWYLDRVNAAAELLYPQILRLPDVAPAATPFASHTAASEWLDNERVNLVTAVRHAAEHGPHRTAWLLSDGLRGYFVLRLYLVDWLTVAGAARSAAEAAGDPAGQAAALLSLANVHTRQCAFELAATESEHGLALAGQIGWEPGELALHNGLANARMGAGDLREAVGPLTEAATIGRRMAPVATLSVILNNLGNLHWQLGHLPRAAEYCTEALELARRTGSRTAAAISLVNLGEVYHAQGRLAEALELVTEALALHHEAGGRGGNTEAMRQLAAVHADAGRYATALELARSATALARDIGDQQHLADVLVTLGYVHQLRGEPAEAQPHFREAYRHTQAADLRHSGVDALIGLAATDLGTAEAVDHATTALRTARRYGYGLTEGTALSTLAAAWLARDDPGRAVAVAGEALDVQRAIGDRLGQARTLLVLGHALGDEGRDLWREALEIFEECGAGEAAAARALLSGDAVVG